MNERHNPECFAESNEAIDALIARTAVVIPTYWSRSYGLRRPGDSVEDHPTPVNEQGTMARLLHSLEGLAEKPRLVLILVASAALDVATSAAWQVDTIRDRFPDLPIALWAPTHVQVLQGRLRSLGHDQWASWFDARGYPQIRNMQLLVPYVLDFELVVALDDDEVIEDPHFLRRAAGAVVQGASNGERVYGAAGYYLDEHGNRLHEVTPAEAADPNPFERKMALMNGMLERIEAQPGTIVPAIFALGGNMSFSRELIHRVGFDPSVARGEDIDYVINAALVGIPYHFDKSRPVRHLPPPGSSYKDFDYAKLQQDVRRFLYEREKLRAAADTSLCAIPSQELDPYPGTFLDDRLEAHALEALSRHFPKLFDISIQEPRALLRQARDYARQAAREFFAFTRQWPEAIETLGRDPVMRHVARSVLP